MTYKEILLQELETASDEVLAEAIDFIRFLKTKSVLHSATNTKSAENPNAEPPDDPRATFSTFLADLKPLPLRRTKPLRQETQGKDLLKFVDTWQGNDLEDCLQFVQETRSQSEF
ncbi:hypothetical protein [Phormidesmis sp. 146-33]